MQVWGGAGTPPKSGESPAFALPIARIKSSVVRHSETFASCVSSPGSLATPTRIIFPCLDHDVPQSARLGSPTSIPPKPHSRALFTFRATFSRRPPRQPPHFLLLHHRGLGAGSRIARQEGTSIFPGCGLPPALDPRLAATGIRRGALCDPFFNRPNSSVMRERLGEGKREREMTPD